MLVVGLSYPRPRRGGWRLVYIYHYTCVQSGMIVPDKPPIVHAVTFWLNQYALYSLPVTASWDVYTMGH